MALHDERATSVFALNLSLAAGSITSVKPCPWPHFPKSSAPTVSLHEPLDVHLQTSGHLLEAVHLSFEAPYPVSGAREEYTVDIPDASCGPTGTTRRRSGGEVTGYAQSGIGRDVAQGETVSHELTAGEVFTGACALPGRKDRLNIKRFELRSATIQVRYRHTGYPPVLIGSTTIAVPSANAPRARRGRATRTSVPVNAGCLLTR
jgi:hypothetical protein